MLRQEEDVEAETHLSDLRQCVSCGGETARSWKRTFSKVRRRDTPPSKMRPKSADLENPKIGSAIFTVSSHSMHLCGCTHHIGTSWLAPSLVLRRRYVLVTEQLLDVRILMPFNKQAF